MWAPVCAEVEESEGKGDAAPRRLSPFLSAAIVVVVVGGRVSSSIYRITSERYLPACPTQAKKRDRDGERVNSDLSEGEGRPDDLGWGVDKCQRHDTAAAAGPVKKNPCILGECRMTRNIRSFKYE